MTYVLHGARGSGSCTVECVLAEIGTDYELRDLSLRDDEQEGEEYAAVNPHRKVPSLVIDDGPALTESVAILLTLDDRHPEGPRRSGRRPAPRPFAGNRSDNPCWPSQSVVVNGRKSRSSVILAYRGKQWASWLHGPTERLPSLAPLHGDGDLRDHGDQRLSVSAVPKVHENGRSGSAGDLLASSSISL